jgi:hypothetical protein
MFQVKHPEVAQFFGGRLYDCVFKFNEAWATLKLLYHIWPHCISFSHWLQNTGAMLHWTLPSTMIASERNYCLLVVGLGRTISMADTPPYALRANNKSKLSCMLCYCASVFFSQENAKDLCVSLHWKDRSFVTILLRGRNQQKNISARPKSLAALFQAR